MLYIHGLGHAHPDTHISNDFLEGLGTGLSAEETRSRLGIICRRSVLPLDYIRETFNADPRHALAVATHTPTTLGVAAARMAMERAEISEAYTFRESLIWMIGSAARDARMVAAEIHIWRIPLSEQGAMIHLCRNLLSADEVHRADRFHFDKDRQAYIIARAG